MSITLTERAAIELKDLMDANEKPDAALRVWVAGGGCSGLSYGMALDDSQPEEDDTVHECFGIKVVVDSLSLQYMAGSSVDFIGDSATGGFKVENPNAVSSCGCGSSFKTEDSEGPSGGGCGSCCGSRG